MLKKDNISQDNPTLQNLYWPPVNYSMPSKHIKSYLTTDLTLDELLENNQDFDQVGEVINEVLSEIYAYIYGYKDSMLFQQQDDLLEKIILSKKIELEHYFLYNWLDLDGFSEVSFES